MCHRISVVAMAAVALGLAAGAAAQATHTTEKVPGTATVSHHRLNGEVVYVSGDSLVAKMIPSGEYRLFLLRPGKTATVNGKVMALNQVSKGTALTADVTVTQTPVVDRTITTVKGTVFWASPRSVILTLENGENRQYDVPEGLKVDVGGTMKEPMELRPGMKVTATKVVEVPRTEITQDSVVTGTK
jgi:hypothetical protein